MRVVGTAKRRWQRMAKGARCDLELIIVANSAALCAQRTSSVQTTEEAMTYFKVRASLSPPHPLTQLWQPGWDLLQPHVAASVDTEYVDPGILPQEFWNFYGASPLLGRNVIVKGICPHVRMSEGVVRTGLQPSACLPQSKSTQEALGQQATDLCSCQCNVHIVVCQLCGMFMVKLAFALTVIGGVGYVDGTGLRVRAESHMLLIGDPGTGMTRQHWLCMHPRTPFSSTCTLHACTPVPPYPIFPVPLCPCTHMPLCPCAPVPLYSLPPST